MVANNESQTAQLFRNCLSVRKTPDGLVPLRFTEAQLSVYTESELFQLRSLCTAGVALDIVSDSRFFQLDYSILGIARDWLYFDVFLDGAFVASIGSSPISAKDGCCRYEFSGEPGVVHRITIYLPHTVEVAVTKLSFAAGAFVEPAPHSGRRLLCLGDSITQGMAARHPSSTYPVLLSRALDADLLNQGVGGYVFNRESIAGFPTWKPDLVTIAYGTNDWVQRSSAEEFERKCAGYLDTAVHLFPSVPIVVITPFHRMDSSTERPSGSFSSIGATIKRICADISKSSTGCKLIVIDGTSIIPHQARFFDDGLHPTDEGFLRIALNIVPILLQRLPLEEIITG